MGPPYDYGQPDALLPWQRSAKMVVLENLLRLWKGELLVLPPCMLLVTTTRHSTTTLIVLALMWYSLKPSRASLLPDATDAGHCGGLCAAPGNYITIPAWGELIGPGRMAVFLCGWHDGWGLGRGPDTQEHRYVRMDGTTSIGTRQTLIRRFNADESLFIFILTTR